jgi:hypothetical protein
VSSRSGRAEMSRYLTVEEVAEALGVSASWVYKNQDLLVGNHQRRRAARGAAGDRGAAGGGRPQQRDGRRARVRGRPHPRSADRRRRRGRCHHPGGRHLPAASICGARAAWWPSEFGGPACVS